MMTNTFNATPKLLLVLCFTGLTGSVYAEDILVTNVQELAQAFQRAGPGDKVILSPGIYTVDRLKTGHGGTAESPVSVEPQIPGTAIINAIGVEALSISQPYWIVQGLTIQGTVYTDHAFHITRNADNVVIRNNTLIDFNAHIKVNGENQVFPNNGLIEHNDIFNRHPRQTDLPVTTIDIVGGHNWRISGNYIADFAKLDGNQTSYGLFLKGNSSQGVIADNLIICSQKTQGGIRIGMSFGGGGTGQLYCEKQDCSTEHTGGIMRNNVVLNCLDVGIYLNRAHDSLITNNTLLMTSGIDVRFPQSSAVISDNILTGGIRPRDGGKIDELKNLAFGTKAGIVLPSINLKLQQRISDYDIKFPNWISRTQVELAQNLIAGITAKLEESDLGLGQNRTKQCFPALSRLDLTPNQKDCGEFWLDNEHASNVNKDFWGTPRSSQRNVMGAIDFYSSQCQLNNRIEHQAATAAIHHCLP
jgi:parallel beta-helix repeat protein